MQFVKPYSSSLLSYAGTKDVRERVSEFNEPERGCRGGERDLTSEQEAAKCQSS